MITLFFMFIFSFIHFSATKFALFAKQNTLQFIIFTSTLIQAKQTLRKLDWLYLISHCKVAAMSAKTLALQNDAFWEKYNCTKYVSFGRLDFVIEDLKEDICAILGNQQAHYYRITMLIRLRQYSSSRLLQATIVLPEPRTQACPGKTRILQPGIQMQREIMRRT